jgi:hypothetical protein
MQVDEAGLYRAVLIQTVQDVRNCATHFSSGPAARADVQLQRRALDWVADDSGYPFSFKDCCHTLGLNLSRVRRVIQGMARNTVSRGL